MQAAAITSRFLTGCSSSSGFTDSEIVVSHGGLIQHIVSSRLAQTVHTQEAFLNLTNALIHFAEQAYSRRDPDALKEISGVLMNLPIDAARQVGLYYHALAINRRGQRDEAETLLEMVVDNAPIAYRARAIQTLGTNLHDKGQLDEALRFQLEALRAASDRNAHGLQTTLLARLEIATIKSLNEDHKGALALLESIWPLVQIVGRQNPLYFYFYQNELAVDFGELGRIAEAEDACKIALAYPFASAYPEWAQTRQELEAKRTAATPSIVAVNQSLEAESSPQVRPQRQTKTSTALALNWLASDKTSFQRSIIPIPAIAITALTAISILDRVLFCIGPRAPPARF
ncbi:MAG: hypothetical protein AABO57_19340 [Acidobacteriota bacterium]